MKKNTKKYETFCPLFPGFYGTLFEYENEDSDIEEYNRENGTNLGYGDFEWDYVEYHKRVSDAFVTRMENELNDIFPVKMEFQELHSPKEYNFYNDSIWVTVELNLKVLLTHIKANKKEAGEYFKNKYTSCSGFISFHSPDIETWLNPAYILEDSKHRIGALLDCLCSIMINEDDIYYWIDSENWVDFWPKLHKGNLRNRII